MSLGQSENHTWVLDRHGTYNCTTSFVLGGYAHVGETKTCNSPGQVIGCFYCGKLRHYKRFYYILRMSNRSEDNKNPGGLGKQIKDGWEKSYVL